MTSLPAVLALTVLALMFLLAPAPPTHAQAVGGDLRDVDGDRPLPGARLYLLDDGVAVDSTRTDRGGRFHLAAPRAGEYVVYFQIDGWASVGSEPLRLDAGTVVDFKFRVPLVPHAAMRQMSDMIRMDERLQTSLPEICGEPLRLWEAGLLVGVVRRRATGQPIAGASVAVASADDVVARSTLTSRDGIYVLCNVPVGSAVEIIVESPDGTIERTDVEIRAGTVSWYDLPV